ncbi:uncharacterized protein LTR77_009930 [Saxophila tyrrhenica]|uniref:Uncharacterized protein n=1 Tax=Saxophila tyrrhenica TaxID=1690608 RepID=A0AAV9NXC8_9PEZI|nr:hypothetical protein LTR77_009930 [Saxophila tyrrhenica]
MAAPPPAKLHHPNRITKPQHHKKLPRLPQNAQITKRPLLHPAIPSPHAGANQPKVIYVSSRTKFIPVVKRVEKLLALAEKRAMQSATTLIKQRKGRGQRSFGGRGRGEDELLEIAQAVEAGRADQEKLRGGKAKGEAGGEEVVLKGTGKAVQKVLEFGLWFQQRGERFSVELRTGSVAAIDDVEVPEEVEDSADVADAMEKDEPLEVGEDRAMEDDGEEAGVSTGAMDVDDVPSKPASKKAPDRPAEDSGIAAKNEIEPIPETRVRYTSSLEVHIRRK